MAKSVARVTGTMQFTGSIPAALLAFAQDSLHDEQKHSAHAYEIILQ